HLENPYTLSKTYQRWVNRQFRVLTKSLKIFQSRGSKRLRASFAAFKKKEKHWLDDYAMFMAIKDHFKGKPWNKWPTGLANRKPAMMKAWKKKLRDGIEFRMYCQWIFFRQWAHLKKYANNKGIDIMGDLPFFVRYDSEDVWQNKKLFLLDKRNRARVISGVPPDYFSSRGQVWDDPQYDWKAMERTDFAWWVERFQSAFSLFDFVRVDHFRGFRAVWHIKQGSKTARNGAWVSVPGEKLFRAIKKRIRALPVVAEDLGFITKDVVDLRKKLGFPGMHVMQFGFSGSKNNYNYPDNFVRNSVAYTGTHDNDTARGWITSSARAVPRKNALKYTRVSKKDFAWKFLSKGMKSPANTFIVPMQDVLNLGSQARMNKPGTKKGNWQWRLGENLLTLSLARKLKKITKAARR
ncbi:4-alpha-glucanotransferase, partial [Patescibacteria group bacterium]